LSHRRGKIDESQLSAGESAECLSSSWQIKLLEPSHIQVTNTVEINKVTVDKIRAAGKVAGKLVTADELPYWLEKGVQFFYIHSDPFLRLGLNGIKRTLGR